MLDQAGQPPPLHSPRLLEVHEVAFLFKSSQETVLRLIRKGLLPAIRPFGRSWRVDPLDLKAFLDARRVSPGNGHNGNGHGHPPDDRGPDNGREA